MYWNRLLKKDRVQYRLKLECISWFGWGKPGVCRAVNSWQHLSSNTRFKISHYIIIILPVLFLSFDDFTIILKCGTKS